MLGAAYMLYLYQRTMFGKIENPKNERLLDLSHREFATFAPLLVLAVWIGLYPAPFLAGSRRSVQQIVARVSPQYARQRRRCDTRADPEASPPSTTRAAQFLTALPCDANGNAAAGDERGTGPGDAAGLSLSDFYYILPELVLTGGALLVLIADVLLPARQRGAGVGDAAGARRDGRGAGAVRATRTSRSRTACSRSIGSRSSSRSSSSARPASPC